MRLSGATLSLLRGSGVKMPIRTFTRTMDFDVVRITGNDIEELHAATQGYGSNPEAYWEIEDGAVSIIVPMGTKEVG